jgi:hypothetical protein
VAKSITTPQDSFSEIKVINGTVPFIFYEIQTKIFTKYTVDLNHQ